MYSAEQNQACHANVIELNMGWFARKLSLQNHENNQFGTRGVLNCGLAVYIKKYCKAKEELWKLKYFTMQKYNLRKNPLKETKIFQDIITLYLNSSFNTTQNIIFQKSSDKNRPIT